MTKDERRRTETVPLVDSVKKNICGKTRCDAHIRLAYLYVCERP